MIDLVGGSLSGNILSHFIGECYPPWLLLLTAMKGQQRRATLMLLLMRLVWYTRKWGFIDAEWEIVLVIMVR